jgi:hypothetical protein
MRREIPAVRILPMSDKAPGFVNRDIANVQRTLFLQDLPTNGGRFRYPRAGLNALAGTIVLFQYRAHVIASAVFVRDERFDRPRRGYAGALHFEVASIRTFDPVDAKSMRAIWPAFRTFGHVKQFLNPGRYAIFKRRLKRVQAPTHPSPPPPRRGKAPRAKRPEPRPRDLSPPPSTLTNSDN